MLAEDERTGCEQDVRQIAHQILNKSVGKKLISKQEATVIALGILLYDCSETISDVSVSNFQKIEKESSINARKKIHKQD